MNKFLKGALCAGLCVAMIGAAGCKKSDLNPETRQLRLATGALDGNFNPFFYTAQNDGNMIALTQISMLTNDKNGNLVCGDDWPTVAESFTEKMINAAGNQTENGAEAVKTEYRFVIKDGIKFSDGTPLTINDVLFNFYVYLDPAYTGSATMYSTDIQGLKAYRAQRPNLSDTSTDASLETKFMNDARLRIDALIDWSTEGSLGPVPANLKDDYDVVTELFQTELESDWTNVFGSWREGYKTSYRFQNTWEAFYFQEGLVEVQTRQVVDNEGKNQGIEQIYEDKNGDGERQDYELYYTTLDVDQTGTLPAGVRAAQNRIDEMAEATSQDKINEYVSAHNCSQEDAYEALSRDRAIKTVYNNFTSQRQLYQVLSYWSTATEALNYFASDERTTYYDGIKENNNGELLVKTISGISTETSGDGKDVLKIVINGIDPKAIYNFSIPIAPLHYYSGYYKDKDYVAAAKSSSTEFGIEFGDSNFFRTVLQDADKNGKPVGAGAYKCTDSRGGDNVGRTDFFENNVCYFKRNDNFETVAKNISNAKIKFVNYKVYNDDKIMEALETEEIDYGSPNATNTNQNKVGDIKHLEAAQPYYTGGYGYVGINPKFVPEYKVRQAIMKAFDVNMTIGFYGRRLATTINRPMSMTSWAYPDGVDVYDGYGFAGAEEDIHEIEDLVREAGYTKGSDGILVKTNDRIPGMKNASLGTKLKLTFTIAGETTDHPAYSMFTTARDILNPLGFDITVQTDIQALKKMTSGNLAVWAAAWSSATDPDMYQVYHKDSTASSVNNWNYRNILTASSEWPYEYNIITKLSDKIEEGRNSIERNERIPVYADCLDLVMQLAVEFPTYQRSDLNVYNKNVIDGGSLVQGANHYIGTFDMIWNINYVK